MKFFAYARINNREGKMAQASVTRSQTDVLVNDFVRSVYNWMAIGLCLTGFVAYYVSNNEA